MLKELKNIKIIPLEDLKVVNITSKYLIIEFKNIGNTKLPKK